MFEKLKEAKSQLNNKIRTRVNDKISDLKKVPEKVLHSIFLTSLNIFNSALHELIVSKGLDPNNVPGQEKIPTLNDALAVAKKAKYLAYTTGMPSRNPFPKLKESTAAVLDTTDINSLVIPENVLNDLRQAVSEIEKEAVQEKTNKKPAAKKQAKKTKK